MSDQPILAASSEALLPRAQALALQAGIECLGVVSDLLQPGLPALLLSVTPQGLALQATGKGAPGPVWVDFCGGALAHRRKFGGGAGQLIAKAVGIKGSCRPTILDATAGLGRDSFVLASLGCRVTLVERSSVIQLLLADGLQRALQDPEAAPICQQMQLVGGDAIDLLSRGGSNAQVVYLDPMFPHREKSALVKKEMRAFRQVVGDDADGGALLAAALASGCARVVVKRPRKAAPLAGPAPGYQLGGKSSRYDIYPLHKLA